MKNNKTVLFILTTCIAFLGFHGSSQYLQKNIPKHWAPLSKYSQYGINEYFKEKSKIK